MRKQLKISIRNDDIAKTQEILPNYLFMHDFEDELEYDTLNKKLSSFIERIGVVKEAARVVPSTYTITIQARIDENGCRAEFTATSSSFTGPHLEELKDRIIKKAIECVSQ